MTTDAPPVTLAEFLLARLAEDEAAALAAVEAHDGRRRRVSDGGTAVARGCLSSPPVRAGRHATHLEHIARHDPARVLADVAAKRAMFGVQWPTLTPPGELSHGDNGEWALDMTLRALAQPYAGEPGWREEWANE